MIYTCRWCHAEIPDTTPFVYFYLHMRAHGIPTVSLETLCVEKEDPMYQIRPAYFRPQPAIRFRLIVAWIIGSVLGALIVYAAVMLWSNS